MVKSRSAGNPPGKAGFLFLGSVFLGERPRLSLFDACRGRAYAVRDFRDKPQKSRRGEVPPSLKVERARLSTTIDAKRWR